MLVVLLLAFVIRVFHLDFQSLWGDEGISLFRSSLPLGEMMFTLPREHVPGYWVLLRVWLACAGTTDFALRYLSLVPSVLAIAIAYRLAADLGSRRAGLLAALLLATSVFQVWYAQEARMYAWLIAVATGSTLFLWRLLNSRRWRPLFVGYVLLLSAALNLHFFGFLVPLGHTVFAVVWLRSRRNVRAFARWFAAGLLVLVLYLPWWPRLLGPSAFQGWLPALDPALVPWRFFTAYLVGDIMPSPLSEWLPWVYLLLAFLGVVTWFRHDRLGGWLLASSAFVSLASACAIAVSTRAFHERYSAFVSVPLALLASAGITAFYPDRWPFLRRVRPGQSSLWRDPLLPALVLALLVGANIAAINRLYTDDGVQKADFRAIVRWMEDAELPGDVILARDSDPREILMHYYRGDLPVHDVRSLEGLSDAEVDSALSKLTEGARRLWMLHFDPPTTAIDYWLARHAWLADRTKYGNENLTLSVYGLPSLSRRDVPLGVAFGPQLQLARAEIAGGDGDGLDFRTGDLLGVTTVWDVLDPVPSLTFSLRLLDDAGRTWHSTDYVPLEGSAPTQTWLPGRQVEDRRGILLPRDLPPGTYDLFLMLYDPSTGVPVRVGDDDGATLAAIEISPAESAPDPAALPIPRRVNKAVSGELELLGFDITPQPLRPGQEASLTLWWRVLDRLSGPYRVRLQAGSGSASGSFDATYSLSNSPAAMWQSGQIVREFYPVKLSPSASGGAYQLRLSLETSGGRLAGEPLNLGPVAVKERPRSYRLPRMSHPVQASLGDHVMLRGYDLTVPEAAGDELALVLYWQATDQVPAGYKVFLHLIDDTGRVVAQADSVPAEGLAPSETWRPREVVADRHVLSAPAGRYRVLVGLSDMASGERLSVLDERGNPIADNAVPIGEVEVR